MENKQIILNTLKRNGKFFVHIDVSRSGMSAKITMRNDEGALLCDGYRVRGCGFNRIVAFFENFVDLDTANKAHRATYTL